MNQTNNIRKESGRQSSIEGFANEHIVVGLLMKRYQNVSLVDLPLSPYDIIIVRKLENDEEIIIRGQVKTAKKSISFTGGTRGGVDREYKSDIKKYIQSPITSDVIIGLTPLGDSSFDMYFVPTILIGIWQTSSKSINKLQKLKNNYVFLERCKDSASIKMKAKEYRII
jgi:hypothetical protein